MGSVSYNVQCKCGEYYRLRVGSIYFTGEERYDLPYDFRCLNKECRSSFIDPNGRLYPDVKSIADKDIAKLPKGTTFKIINKG